MKTAVVAVVLLVLAPALGACGGEDGPVAATDPARSARTPATPTPPSGAPAAVGAVRSVSLPLVMDTGGGPELCTGPVAESYPPQCGGPAVTGWDWSAHAGTFDRQGDIRWGTYAVTGTWDGTSFTAVEAIPGALYDAAPPPVVTLPSPTRDLDEAGLEAVATEVRDTLPWVDGANADGAGHVLVDVTYDDGTVQDYLAAMYGAGVVVVDAALTDVSTR